jgi:hypothetical protein
MSWDTVFRWLETASRYAGQFHAHALKGFEIAELQADEIRTLTSNRKRVRWLFTALEVSSRLWVGLAVGSRTYRNVKRCLGTSRGNWCSARKRDTTSLVTRLNGRSLG